MALVCDDIQSDEVRNEGECEPSLEDLEEGEIDDDEAADPVTAFPIANEMPDDDEQEAVVNSNSYQKPTTETVAGVKFVEEKREKGDKKQRHEKKHLTEAEKSVMRIHKLERLEREKREKYRREQTLHPVIDPDEDFATSLEKAIAKVLKKDKPGTEDEKPAEPEEPEKPEKRQGKKRKKKDKHKKSKKGRPENQEEFDELYHHHHQHDDGFVSGAGHTDDAPSPTNHRSDDEYSHESDGSSDKSGGGGAGGIVGIDDNHRDQRRWKHRKKHFQRRERKHREKEKQNNANANSTPSKINLKRNTGVCLFYLQGNCEDENCPYSHETVQPMKMELCKFYLLDCCAKGNNCLYMHSDFPCKYYHTGIPCPYNENCKFAHGGPLSNGLKSILFKHIETAPKEILGDFPRLSRENASVMIMQAQKNLESKYGPPARDASCEPGLEMMSDSSSFTGHQQDAGAEDSANKNRENRRNRPSRWQDLELEGGCAGGSGDGSPGIDGSPFGSKTSFRDQDMRITSNGDVDMRTMGMPPTINATNLVTPNILAQPPPNMMIPPNLLLPNLRGPLNAVDVAGAEQYKMEPPCQFQCDSDLRQFNTFNQLKEDEDSRLQILTDDLRKAEEDDGNRKDSVVETLPKTQRDLFKRIQAQQQKELVFQQEQASNSDNDDQNIDWYSDDDDDNRLTIKDDFEEEQQQHKHLEPPPIKPLDMEKLGDLSKIDISAEVSKLLSTISRQTNLATATATTTTLRTPKEEKVDSSRDPRLAEGNTREAKTRGDPRDPRIASDPRRSRQNSAEDRPAISIYEQSTLFDNDVDSSGDLDLRVGLSMGRPDVDLRLGLPFKPMQNYTPASEIDASINSHPPILWKVYIVDVPKPNYTGLKLSETEAHNTGDPRLRKIFRLSVDEKESPASPKESPKAPTSAPARVDPRRRKVEEKPPEIPAAGGGPTTYNQQLSMLQSSPFYQSLTSNQKLMLNQELASRNDQSGMCDPIIASMLQSLGLIGPGPSSAGNTNIGGQQTQAMNILNNVGFSANTGGMLGAGGPLPPNSANMGPGLLGPGPPVMPGMPPDFPMNFDPRNNNMLGNGPPPHFGGNYPPESNNFGNNFNDDYYPPEHMQHPGGPGNFNNNRENNRNFRDRPPPRRGRNNPRSRTYFRRQNRNNMRNSPP